MSASLALGLRLARTGGPIRAISIIVGAAVATLLVLLALAIPNAVYPPEEGTQALWRANVTGALLFALAPATVLLITTSRISSGTRDRRLASLRLIGMDRGRAALVAASEAGSLTAIGALMGAGAGWGLTSVADAMAARPQWFAEPLRPSATTALAVVAGVVLAGATIAATPLLRRSDLIQARSASARRRPSLWRLAVPAVGAGLLASLAVAGDESLTWSESRIFGTMVGGGLLAGIGIAVATPVLADAAAAGLLRIRRVPTVLAGRGIQAEPLATIRLVAGLAVALFLALGGSAVLLAYESAPPYRYALQVMGEGPQRLVIGAGDSQDAPGTERVMLDPAQLGAVEEALSSLPGVLMVTPMYEPKLVGCEGGAWQCSPVFFVGTCDDLAQVMTVSGCSDEQPGFISMINVSNPDRVGIPERVPGEPDVTVAFTGGAELTLHLGPDLVQDSAATEERWVYPNTTDVFIPAHLVEATGAGAELLEVVAVGGTGIRDEIAAALPEGTHLRSDYTAFASNSLDDVARVRFVVYLLSAVAIGTAMLGLALTTIDHAREHRQVVARQRVIGMPARTLYAGQLLQALIPLVVAILLATGLGWVLVSAWGAASNWSAGGSNADPLTGPLTAGLVIATTLFGAALLALATIPAARTRLTPTLLRRE